MKKLLISALSCCIAIPALADDTEIYGASEIDNDKRVNSNVLFIMDTSGSMGGDVTITQVAYNPSENYSGSYRTDEFYYSLRHRPRDGIKIDSLSSDSDYECDSTRTALAEEGRSLGNYAQDRRSWWGSSWRNLSGGNDSEVRCDAGNSYWLYTGNYMNWYHTDGNVTQSTRLDVVRDVVKKLTRNLSNINLGLMRFDQDSQGGYIDVAVDDISNTAQPIRDQLDSYYAQGGTPLEESMYEAALYYRGDNIKYGNNSDPENSTDSSRTGSAYKSPITATCQKNHIILLTDGEPTNDNNANDEIRAHINGLTLPNGLSASCSGNGECMDELAYWLRNTDQSGSQVGEQAVTTYTIGGFDLANGVELLKRTAKWGGGQYYAANDTQGLTTALESIFLDILATDSTFTAPAVSVNAFNASEHRDELFYALFRPDDNAKWAGNLKRYRLASDGLVYSANGSPAVSEATGFFNDGSKDYWNDTSENDGANVTLGGMATLLEPGERRIYTDNIDTADTTGTTIGDLVSFSTEANAFTLGVDLTFVDHLKKWVLGYDVDDADGDGSTVNSRESIGDPLHSEPVVVTYGGTDEAPDSTIFFGTNEGFIHAVDTTSGKEQFAFIPRELHKTQNVFYENLTAAGDRPYGMDGPITTWMNDKNKNNIVLTSAGTPEDGEHVYLYAGMRRGGNSYYALDVTNRNNPQLLFKITGGIGDFAKLGQTWSEMTIAKVKFGGESRVVALFTGGYDVNQDGNNVSEPDAIGNAIYMVDAKTGERLWWASNEQADTNIVKMVNSMPASLSAVDINGDQHVDYFFAADTGGRVFRFDINQNNAGASNFAKGGVIASLAGSDIANNRRFYNKPNVAIVKDKVNGDYLTIGIGSGHRAHPIFTQDVENRFYMIKDFHPYGAPTSYQVTTEADTSKTTLSSGEVPDKNKVYNATSLMTGGDSAKTGDMQRIMSQGGGWYVTFSTKGEKVLSQSTTFAGAVIFTTFSPSGGGTTDGCGPDTGTSKIYTLDQKWATATIDLDGDGILEKTDTTKVLAHSGIAPRPVIIYRKGGGKSIAIGTETIDDSRFGDSEGMEKCDTANCYVRPNYWRENELDPKQNEN